MKTTNNKKKKKIAAKVYSLTPKAKRVSMALQKYEEELRRLEQIPDEKIEEMFEDWMESNPSSRESKGSIMFYDLLKELGKLME